jgi:hypothetical protein
LPILPLKNSENGFLHYKNALKTKKMAVFGPCERCFSYEIAENPPKSAEIPEIPPKTPEICANLPENWAEKCEICANSAEKCEILPEICENGAENCENRAEKCGKWTENCGKWTEKTGPMEKNGRNGPVLRCVFSGFFGYFHMKF